MFCGICHKDFTSSNATELKDILSILIYRVEVLEILYSDILQKIGAVFLKQFIRDMHMTFHIGKKIEHEKQIEVHKADSKKNKNKQRKSYVEKDKATEKKTVTGEVKISQPILPVSSNDTSLASNVHEFCGICQELYKPDEERIQYDFCFKWFHRHCVGIKSKAAWKKYQIQKPDICVLSVPKWRPG